jgi:hypothetical protein
MRSGGLCFSDWKDFNTQTTGAIRNYLTAVDAEQPAKETAQLTTLAGKIETLVHFEA